MKNDSSGALYTTVLTQSHDISLNVLLLLYVHGKRGHEDKTHWFVQIVMVMQNHLNLNCLQSIPLLFVRFHWTHSNLSVSLLECGHSCQGQGYSATPGIILYTRPANERRRYNVTSSLTGFAYTQHDPCYMGLSMSRNHFLPRNSQKTSHSSPVRAQV